MKDKEEKMHFYKINTAITTLYCYNKEYKNCGSFSDGFLSVVKEEQIIYLDKEGKKAYELCNVADSLGYQVYLCRYNENRSVFCEGGIIWSKR